ncbi:hypothetical protein Tco_0823932 [Tanacetum coccineum]|uniref:Uncharacterized protein n=1 Tax=Tanacetum coccineum TaxID=301880 RepID=A0ABQ5ANQ4_9ASTR
MQQFWHTITYNLESKTYFFTLDDQSFEVNADLLHDALQITPKDFDHLFVTPPPHDKIVSFIKKIGYLGTLDQVSKMIDSRQISAKRKELLPFPRFTKLIIQHIFSHHNTVFKRLQSEKHRITLDAVLGNLKFSNKGAYDLINGIAIPMEMLSDEIKASTNYLNYLAKSMGIQPATGQERVIKETCESKEVAVTMDLKETDEDEVHLNEIKSGIVIVDMKTSTKASKDNFILKQRTKGPGEGSGVILEVPDGLSDSSDSSSSKSKDEERFLSTDDEANQAKFDDERTKINDSEKAKDVKDVDDQAGEEQAIDEKLELINLEKYKLKLVYLIHK